MRHEIVFHNYPSSPFSEKVRVAFGIKGLSWRSVVQPVIMVLVAVLSIVPIVVIPQMWHFVLRHCGDGRFNLHHVRPPCEW